MNENEMPNNEQNPEGEVIEANNVGNDVAVPAEEKAVETTEEIKPTEEAKVTEFKVALVQRDEDNNITASTAIKFALPEDKAFDADLIIGTTIDHIFAEFELYRAAGSKLFKSSLPLEIAISSEFVSLDLGKIQKAVLLKMKFNSSERSKLLFIDRMIAVLNHAMKPVQYRRLSELREEMATLAQIHYNLPEKPKGLASISALTNVASAKFAKPAAKKEEAAK